MMNILVCGLLFLPGNYALRVATYEPNKEYNISHENREDKYRSSPNASIGEAKLLDKDLLEGREREEKGIHP